MVFLQNKKNQHYDNIKSILIISASQLLYKGVKVVEYIVKKENSIFTAQIVKMILLIWKCDINFKNYLYNDNISDICVIAILKSVSKYTKLHRHKQKYAFNCS